MILTSSPTPDPRGDCVHNVMARRSGPRPMHKLLAKLLIVVLTFLVASAHAADV